MSIEVVPRNTKREAGKMVQNNKKARRNVSPKKAVGGHDLFCFKYFALAVEGCNYYTEPDIVLLFIRLFYIRRRNPPCNAEDDLSAEHIVIEDWFRGY